MSDASDDRGAACRDRPDVDHPDRWALASRAGLDERVRYKSGGPELGSQGARWAFQDAERRAPVHWALPEAAPGAQPCRPAAGLQVEPPADQLSSVSQGDAADHRRPSCPHSEFARQAAPPHPESAVRLDAEALESWVRHCLDAERPASSLLSPVRETHLFPERAWEHPPSGVA